MVQEAARGSVRIDAHGPQTTRPMHRSSGFADDAICYFAVSGSGQIQAARLDLDAASRCPAEFQSARLRSFISALSRQVDASLCKTRPKEPAYRDGNWSGGSAFRLTLAWARSPLKPPSPRGETVLLTEEHMSKYPDEQIRNYAHQLWEKAGRPEGKADEFWRQAEIELDAESESVDPSDQPNASTIPG
jgi:hypothetical protein